MELYARQVYDFKPVVSLREELRENCSKTTQRNTVMAKVIKMTAVAPATEEKIVQVSLIGGHVVRRTQEEQERLIQMLADSTRTDRPERGRWFGRR